MHRPSCFIWPILLLLSSLAHASVEEAQLIEKNWARTMDAWNAEINAAITPEAREKIIASRPDATPTARKMWQAIGGSLDQVWALEPAAWFLRATPGLYTRNPDGSTSLTFSQEIEAIRKAVETSHIKSPGLIPMCMALVVTQNPRTLGILEKIQTENPDPKTQGVAALGAAMILKSLGDSPDIMRKRLTYLRKAVIQSAEVDLGNGNTVVKLAENELYIIRYLTKGRVAPEINAMDSGNRPVSLADYKGKVVILVFWNSSPPDGERSIQMTQEMSQKSQGRPVVILGINNDPTEKLRSLEAEGTITWKNISDPGNKIAGDYRIGSWPLTYILDKDLKIQYTGSLGSFAEATTEALLSPTPAQSPQPTIQQK